MSKIKIMVALLGFVISVGAVSFAGKHLGFEDHAESSKNIGKPSKNSNRQTTMVLTPNHTFVEVSTPPALQNPDKLHVKPFNPNKQKTVERAPRSKN